MTRSSIALVAGLALCASVSTQTITSSPAGLENTPGPSSAVRPFYSSGYRFQVVDHSLAGTAINFITAINFRRDDKAAVVAGAVARTADVTVIMGHGDVRMLQNVWGDNYTAGSSTVFSKKSINLPDLTAQTAGGGAEPWSIRIPLDSPFSYNGTDDFVYETIYENPSVTSSFNLDRAAATSGLSALTFGSTIGAGCTPTGAAGPFSLTTINYSHHGGKLMRLGYQTKNGPANQSVILNISGVQSAITLPGLCSTLVATPDITAVLGTTDSAGVIPRLYLAFPHLASLISGNLYTQAVALDPGATGFPIALSQGADLQWPAPGPSTSSYGFIYSSDPASAQGAGPITFIGPVIAGLEH